MRRELSGLATVAGFDNLYADVIVAHDDGSQQVFEAAKEGEEATLIGIVQPQYFDVFHYRWLSGGGALLIALLTVSWQAIRAATANPVKSLRASE